MSLKTVDRGPNSSWGDLFQHARELAATPITEGGKLQNKILDLRVPPGKIQSVDALKNYAESLGLTVKVSVFK